jgi:hypothetical protein
MVLPARDAGTDARPAPPLFSATDRREERRDVSLPCHVESCGMSRGLSLACAFLENLDERAMHCNSATAMTRAAMADGR